MHKPYASRAPPSRVARGGAGTEARDDAGETGRGLGAGDGRGRAGRGPPRGRLRGGRRAPAERRGGAPPGGRPRRAAGARPAAPLSTPVGPASAARASFSGTGPITFATGKLDTGYLPGLVSQWNAAHPRQRVTVIYLPDDSDQQHAQLVANLQAKSSVYDVMSLDVVWTAEFAASGWITPVSSRGVPLGDFLRPAVETATYEGKLVG